MSDTSELSSPLLAPAHACTDLHSKLVHLNIGETILCRALRNSPESVCNVCVRCLFKSWSLILSLSSLLNLFFFRILGAYSTERHTPDRLCLLCGFVSERFKESGSCFSNLCTDFLHCEWITDVSHFNQSLGQMMSTQCEATSGYFGAKKLDQSIILRQKFGCQHDVFG